MRPGNWLIQHTEVLSFSLHHYTPVPPEHECSVHLMGHVFQPDFTSNPDLMLIQHLKQKQNFRRARKGQDCFSDRNASRFRAPDRLVDQHLTGAAVNLTGVGAGVNLTDALAGSVMDVGA